MLLNYHFFFFFLPPLRPFFFLARNRPTVWNQFHFLWMNRLASSIAIFSRRSASCFSASNASSASSRARSFLFWSILVVISSICSRARSELSLISSSLVSSLVISRSRFFSVYYDMSSNSSLFLVKCSFTVSKTMVSVSIWRVNVVISSSSACCY